MTHTARPARRADEQCDVRPPALRGWRAVAVALSTSRHGAKEADRRARDICDDAKDDELYANLAPESLSPAWLCAKVGHTVAMVKPPRSGRSGEWTMPPFGVRMRGVYAGRHPR